MNQTTPPRLATWMLEHLTPGARNEALAGDLLEDFHSGRSTGWYWRQVVAAIVIGGLRSFFDHRIVLCFAATWSMFSPAWQLIFLRLFRQNNFIGHIWRIPWPWSTACGFGLSTAQDLLFIWAGVFVYVSASTNGNASLRRLRRGLVLSIVVFVVASTCDFALLAALDTNSTGHGVDWRALTLLGVIEDFRTWNILTRFPYLVATACALWGLRLKRANVEGIAEQLCPVQTVRETDLPTEQFFAEYRGAG